MRGGEHDAGGGGVLTVCVGDVDSAAEGAGAGVTGLRLSFPKYVFGWAGGGVPGCRWVSEEYSVACHVKWPRSCGWREAGTP